MICDHRSALDFQLGRMSFLYLNYNSASPADVRTSAGFFCKIPASGTPVQIAGDSEGCRINKDAVLIERNGIPESRRSGIPDPECAEVELPLANAVHQFDA